MHLTNPDEFVSSIVSRAEEARDAMACDAVIGRYVDTGLPIPSPYVGRGEIRLVIIGQDPTVQYAEGQSGIRTVLNLDRAGSALHGFIREQLCAPLGVSLEDEVYATNACKCAFTLPPAAILHAAGANVLERAAPYWLPILRDELAAFPDAVVVSLGELVLAMLVKPGGPHKMINFWGYHRRWRSGLRVPMRALAPDESAVGRAIHPFVHQPGMRSQRPAFYGKRMGDYLAFVRRSLGKR